MKYKVGDEVLVKVRINNVREGYKYPYEVKELNNKSEWSAASIAVREEDVFPVPDMTAEEAWEIARKIVVSASEGGITIEDYENIFGKIGCDEIIATMTPQQAKARIEAWKAEKEIKVGDVVKDCNGKIGVVISKGTSDNVLFDDGSTWNYTDRTLEKTGRHLDIDGFLKQIGGNE